MRLNHFFLHKILLIFILFSSMISASAYTYDFSYQGIYYIITGNNTLSVVRSPSGYGNTVTIPQNVTYEGITYTVTAISDCGFVDCGKLKYVNMPASITEIGDCAFSNCTNLATVVLPNNLSYLGYGAFTNCSKLSYIRIPNTITTINEATFSNCISLNKMTIPNSVTVIGDYAFSYCEGLTTVTFGNSLKTIGIGAFSLCTGLTSIELPQSIVNISGWAFNHCSNLETVTFPEVSSIRRIGIGAFDDTPWYDNQSHGPVFLGSMLYRYKDYDPSETQITLENGFKGIAEGAFLGCDNMVAISLPESVDHINPYAFSHCDALESVTCLALTPPIMDNSECFDSVCYSNATLHMPHSAVDDYSDSEYWKLFADIEGIDYAFDTDFGSYMMTSPNTVSLIHKNNNHDTFTGNVIIPDIISYGGKEFTVTAIGDNAFEGCENMTSITIPNTITTIGRNAFDACSGLITVVIPSSVTSIGYQAFQNCTGLISITLGSGITSIGSRAFFNCNALKAVTCKGETPPVMENSDCFTSTCYNYAKLRVPNNVLKAYLGTNYWNKFINFEEVSEFILGDVNGDGQLSIKDATILIDFLLGGELDGIFLPEYADINGDGRISIKDATMLIDMLLS